MNIKKVLYSQKLTPVEIIDRADIQIQIRDKYAKYIREIPIFKEQKVNIIGIPSYAPNEINFIFPDVKPHPMNPSEEYLEPIYWVVVESRGKYYKVILKTQMRFSIINFSKSNFMRSIPNADKMTFDHNMYYQMLNSVYTSNRYDFLPHCYWDDSAFMVLDYFDEEQVERITPEELINNSELKQEFINCNLKMINYHNARPKNNILNHWILVDGKLKYVASRHLVTDLKKQYNQIEIQDEDDNTIEVIDKPKLGK